MDGIKFVIRFGIFAAIIFIFFAAGGSDFEWYNPKYIILLLVIVTFVIYMLRFKE